MADNKPVSPVAFAEWIEHSPDLDPAADTLHRWAARVIPGGRLGEELRGRSLGHSLHPVLTDIPIGLWTSAVLLDVFGGPDQRKAARWFVGAGVASAIPTALTGVADVPHLTVQGRRLATTHAALNTTTLACFTASWCLRGTRHRGAALVASAMGAAAVSVSAFLGGHLAHHRHEPEDDATAA